VKKLSGVTDHVPDKRDRWEMNGFCCDDPKRERNGCKGIESVWIWMERRSREEKRKNSL